MKIFYLFSGLLVSILLLNACTTPNPKQSEKLVVQDSSIESQTDSHGVTVNQDCSPDDEYQYICDLIVPEDVILLSDTGPILASGMTINNAVGSGHLYLIDPEKASSTELFFNSEFSFKQNINTYPDCPSPLNLNNFSVHGISARKYAENQFDVYFTNHGERESIEMLKLDLRAQPKLTWVGCVPLPEYTLSNNLVILEDGGFVSTRMFDTRIGFSAVQEGLTTGFVYEWHPGSVVTKMEGTDLSGPNGIAISQDMQYLFVAAFGTREIVRFDLTTAPIYKETIKVDITPDNLNWSSDDKLLTAGFNYVSPEKCENAECNTGWSILEIDANTLSAKRVGGGNQHIKLQGASSAVRFNGEFWAGAVAGDRIVHFPE